jgi:hypothetical protein
MFAGSALFLVTGCTSNILVTKHGERYFLATKQAGLKKLLCDSGDMVEILKDAQLSKPLEQRVSETVCAEKVDKEKVLTLLDDMTKEEREQLKSAFGKNGYDVNIVMCG